MAQILSLSVPHSRRAWPPQGERLSPPPDGARALAATLAALETLREWLRIAWWDGSAVRLSRGGLEALVGLEPGDATPCGRRLAPVRTGMPR